MKKNLFIICAVIFIGLSYSQECPDSSMDLHIEDVSDLNAFLNLQISIKVSVGLFN